MSKRALIIGGSLGGLIAAHLLRSVGWDATVFERNADDLVSRGAGIGTHQHLIDILRRVGIAFDDSMGVRVSRVLCLDRSGAIVLAKDTVRVMSGWARLYRSLQEALPAECYRLGRALTRVETDDAGVTAIFADGARERGDLLVGADGIRSTVRAQFLPEAQPVYAGYVAWRAMIEERDIPEKIRAEVCESYAFCDIEGEQCLGYPVPGRDNDTAAGRRAYNIVWYRPTDAATTLVDLTTDASGRHHGMAIPPPLIRPDVIAAIKATARALIAPQIAEIFARSEPFFQPIFDLESSALAFGQPVPRVALLGDAAFVARPHVGAGVTKAALDAASLADALAAHGGDLAAALARYQREQIKFGRGIVDMSREEGAYISAQLKPPHERRGAELPRDIHSLMAAHHQSRDRVRALAAQCSLGG
ncbi:MAG TPA: FAD-dependent monooxygenase [Xanthobacteraceae bacterium]|nr:FAD-dependent monooxygenase [Xanthobacteraceae bacterium]